MTLAIELTPELEDRLRAAAAARGTDAAGAILQFIESLPDPKPTTGAALTAALDAIEEPSVFARFPEEADELARRLRKQAETRDAA